MIERILCIQYTHTKYADVIQLSAYVTFSLKGVKFTTETRKLTSLNDGSANCQNALSCYQLSWVFLSINYNFPCV